MKTNDNKPQADNTSRINEVKQVNEKLKQEFLQVTEKESEEPAHGFSPEQADMILMAVRSIVDIHGSALLLNSTLTDVLQQSIELRMEDHKSGGVYIDGNYDMISEQLAAFRDVKTLCCAIDQARDIQRI